MARQTAVSVRVVSNNLPGLDARAQAALVAEVKRSAFEIEAGAKAKAPVRTGTLRRSIHSTFSNGGLRAQVGPSVSYGIFIELGTRRMAARPYLRPAAEAVYPRFADRVKAILRTKP